jgi:hypothetical protein
VTNRWLINCRSNKVPKNSNNPYFLLKSVLRHLKHI